MNSDFGCLDHFLTIEYQFGPDGATARRQCGIDASKLCGLKTGRRRTNERGNYHKSMNYPNSTGLVHRGAPQKGHKKKDIKVWENITNTGIYRQLHENTTEDGEKDAEKMDFASVRKKKHCKDDRRSKAHKRVNVQLGSCNKPHEKDETKDFRTKVNCANLGTFGDTKRCCRPGGDVVNNRNNNSSYSSRGSSKSSATSMGNTPLSVLKKERNTWTLVPTSHFDTNRNQGGGCQAYEDWPGSLGMKKGVYLETPHIDFLLCIARSGQSYDEIMSRCETALMAADVNNVTESYLIAAKYGLQNVMDTLLELIRENFILVSQTKQFLELPVDLMELFLSDTFVNVGDELDVFAAALRWVDYNKQDRLALSGRVLNCIRYEKIRPVDIRDHVEPNIHLFNGPCGPEALVNIYRKHALDCAGVDDPGPLGPRPTHDELVEEMARKPATTPGREHAQRIAAAQPDGAVAASMKGKGGGRGKGRGAKKPPPAKNEEAPAEEGKGSGRGRGKRKGKGKVNNKNASQQESNNNLISDTTSAGAKVRWRDGSDSTNSSVNQGDSFSFGDRKSRGSQDRLSRQWRVSASHADPSPEDFPPRPRRESRTRTSNEDHRIVSERGGSLSVTKKKTKKKKKTSFKK